ncbi:aspartate/glutamate racemase family protein [Uliginosibacterium sediminicola]|uniref:Aspartate/glutamate racemase family protein n=1 Tax=Uliginosibacterium sediminicola TaxID=2024550 RepID=A0ABU9YYM8_9RHOO
MSIKRIALLNPNTNDDTTQMMLGIAQQALLPASRVLIEGRTAPRGQSLIVNEPALAEAAQVVQEYGPQVAAEGFDALIVAAFGDPGLTALREQLAIPVTGIAEAGIAEAAAGGRRYSIVSTTPELRNSLQYLAGRYGHADSLVSIRITRGEVQRVMQDPLRMAEALLDSCRDAIELDGAEAIVIGGGPLASAARAIAALLGVPVIEPVVAAVRLSLQRCTATTA